jgi:hypothetical protein
MGTSVYHLVPLLSCSGLFVSLPGVQLMTLLLWSYIAGHSSVANDGDVYILVLVPVCRRVCPVNRRAGTGLGIRHDVFDAGDL